MTEKIKPIGENNNLSLVFGNNARIKIIYTLIYMEDIKLTKSEVAKHANVSRPTVYDHVDELLLMNIIKENKDGKIYINKNSNLAKSIANVEWQFIKTWADWENKSDDKNKKLQKLGKYKHN